MGQGLMTCAPNRANHSGVKDIWNHLYEEIAHRAFRISSLLWRVADGTNSMHQASLCVPHSLQVAAAVAPRNKISLSRGAQSRPWLEQDIG